MKNGQKIIYLSRLVTDHPWWIILLTLITVSILSIGLGKLDFKNDYRVYFSQENPQLQAFNAIQETYNKTDSVIFILQPAEDTVFTPQTLHAIQELTKKSWKVPYSSRVDSITNFQYTRAVEDDLWVTDLVNNPQLSLVELARIKQVALHEPLLVNRLVSTQGHVAGVNVTLQLPGISPSETMEVAMAVRDLAQEIENKFSGTKIYITGMAMLSNAFSESAMMDNKILIPVMYIIVTLVLLFCLRSISATFSVLLLIVFSIFSALGTAGWLGWFLTPTSAIAPTIILTMAIADCVHLLMTQLHHMRKGQAKCQAIRESLKINFQPIFLTSLTTAIGFLSMNFSDAPPFRDLGNMVAIGVMFAWLLSITFLPALISLLPIKVSTQNNPDNQLIQRLSEWVICYRRPLLVINGLMAILLIAFVPQNQLNDEFVNYFDKSTSFRQGTDFMTENMGGIYNISFSIDTLEQGAINRPVYLNRVDKLSQWLHAQPEVTHVNTITDTFKRLNKNMHGDKPVWYRLPELRTLAAQYLLLYEMSLPYGLDLNDQINFDKSGIQLIATLKNMSSNQILAFELRIKQWLAQNMSEYEVNLGSPILMFSHIGSRNIIRMLIGSIMALILISFLLSLAFRSIKLGLISLLPNLVPAGIAFGIWGLINGQIGLGLSAVTGMTLGIVVDDTVHFISKYRYARVSLNFDSENAVRYAFSTVGVALWITTLVLVCGFMVLSLSHFTLNADMGLMTAITIATALILDLLFLPPLLMSMEKK